MRVNAAKNASREKPEIGESQDSPTIPVDSGNRKPVWVESDLDFKRALGEQCGYTFETCFQCGTCSSTCALTPDSSPFPRKEMAWALWGMKDRLLKDPDVWLCYQCNDCSTRCPRGARPGDVLAAVRREGVIHYAVPRFMGRWLSRPQYIPLLLGIPAALLSAALVAKEPVERALGLSAQMGEEILYSYSSVFPHWLLNTFFAFFSLLVVLAVAAGVVRFWRAMMSNLPPDRSAAPAMGLFPSIVAALKRILIHDKFADCTTARPRLISHISVFFGFLALFVVSIWVFTSGINPLLHEDFIYPFGFWNPWKILANIGGVALVAGCLLMIRDRMRSGDRIGSGTYFDWALIVLLLLVAFSGFFTEVLHYLRLEPHRHIVYFIHLVFVFAVLMYLPYSKLAHLVYRGTALVFAEYSGRSAEAAVTGAGDDPERAIPEEKHAS